MAATIDADVVAGYIKLANLEGLQKFAAPSFDWRQPLSEQNLPALVLVLNEGLVHEREKRANLLKITNWLLKAGADPRDKISQSKDGRWNLWKRSNKDQTQIGVDYAGHSAVSYAFAWLGQLQLGKGGVDWPTERKYVEDLVGLFAGTTAAKNPRAADVTVPQTTLDLWESIRHRTSSHNVIFDTSDGEVSAHDHVLAVASPVLQAMLESAMKEGTSRRIQVKDSSASAVSLFLDLLYTSSTRADPDHETMLVALDLAHRWQVHGVVATLCVALRDVIDAKSFVAIAESAALKGLETLQRACASFGSNNKQVQAMLKRGGLPVSVRKLLGQPERESGEEREPKKRRLFRSS